MEIKYNNIQSNINRLIINTNHKLFKNNTTFYPRVVNKTNIIFKEEQIILLQKGLKYNLHHKPKNWINNLSLEAETAIQQIPIYNQDIVRHQTAKKPDSLYKHQLDNYDKHTHRLMFQEKTIITQILSLLNQHKATITKAYKGNSLIIIYEDEYYTKTQEFIDNNHFTPIQNVPTNTYQRDLKHTLNKCNKFITKDQKWKYYNMDPTAPKLRSLIKIHKTNNTNRHIVNWKDAPAYKISRDFS